MKTIGIILGVSFVLLQMSCQRPTSNPVETPISPQPDSSKVSDSGKTQALLFVGSYGFDYVYMVDCSTNTVIDTLRGFESIYDIAASKGGQKLYVCARQGLLNTPGKVFVTDLRTKQNKVIHEQSSDVYIAPDGTPIIIASEPRNPIRRVGIIDTLSDQITFIDSLDIQDLGLNYNRVVFHPSQPVFYTVNNALRLFAYNYKERRILRTYTQTSDPLRMAISRDGRFLYAGSRPVLDLERDVSVGRIGISQISSVLISPNDSLLYVSDPGNYGRLEPVPSGKLFYYRANPVSFGGEIDFVSSTPTGERRATDRMILAPDGKIIYISNWAGMLYVFNASNNQVVGTIKLFANNMPLAITTRRLP